MNRRREVLQWFSTAGSVSRETLFPQVGVFHDETLFTAYVRSEGIAGSPREDDRLAPPEAKFLRRRFCARQQNQASGANASEASARSS